MSELNQYYIDLPYGKFCFESEYDFNEDIDENGLVIMRLNNYIDNEPSEVIKVLNLELYEILCVSFKWSEFIIKRTGNGPFFYIILDDNSFGSPSFKVYPNDQ